MIENTVYKRVRYAEADKMGYLYYGRYATLYEIGRSELIRDLGLSYRAFEDEHGIIMPVVHMESRYRAPAFYDDILTIRTRLENMPTRMISFHHIIENQEGKILNLGVVKLFFVNSKTGNKVTCPSFLSIVLKPYFET